VYCKRGVRSESCLTQAKPFHSGHQIALGVFKMRHIISVLLQNEAGALSRVTNLFSTRGFNIESLNVAPTDDETVSRLTVVSTGSDAVIDQISKHLGKLVDVVNIVDMTGTDHIERELALFKLRLPKGGEEEKGLAGVVEEFGGHILDDSGGHFTVELISGGSEIDRFMAEVAEVGEVESLTRSGAMAVTKGAPFPTMG
jgi:acetolactate synthase I/III small subunit